MKKTLWLILVLLLVCVFALSACDNGDTPSNNDNGNDQQTTEENGENNSGGENDNSSTPVGCQHTFGSWSTIKQATCKEEGKLVRTCSKCSETEESTVSKIDTHTEVVDAAVSATCTVDGKTEGKHCSVCGKTIVAQTTVKASGHIEVVDPAVNATCETEGKSAGKHCSVCGTVTVEQVSTGVIPHSYKFGACIECKKINNDNKNAEFAAEDARHEQEVVEITDSYNDLVELNEERINNLKEQYNISYVYDNLTCYEKVSDLQSEISTISRRISLLESYDDPADLATIASLKTQKQSKEQEKAKYEAMIDIHRYEQAILSHKDTYDSDIGKEDILHEKNIEALEKKYSCFESKHTLKILESEAPNCDDTGLTEGLFCEICEVILVEQKPIAANGHSANESTGLCSVCGSNMVEAGLVFELNDDNASYAVTDYTGNNPIVVVPDKYNNLPVTSINDSAFSNCTTLRNITLPNSITFIGDYAFNNCSNLENLILPKNLITIGESAFNQCSCLKEIIVPNKVESIGRAAFSGCSALETITLPFVGASLNATKASSSTLFGYIFGNYYFENSVDANQSYASGSNKTYYIPSNLKHVTITGGNILYGAFYDCTKIETVNLPSDITSIGDYAFAYCSSLKSIAIPDGVESITERLLYCCSSLEAIEIGAMVSSVGYEAFYNCKNLKSIVVNEGNETYAGTGNCLIHKASKILILGCENSVIPNDGTVTEIGYQSFIFCETITNIIIPNGVTKIWDYAFYGCSNLTSIVIGENVESIGSAAFGACWKLVEVYNFSDITITKGQYGNGDIGAYALNVYTSTADISKLWTTADGFIFYEDGDVCYLLGYTGNTQDIVLPDDCNGKTYTIYKHAFENRADIVTITIPKNVTTIAFSAFYNCSGLTTVYYKGTPSEWSRISIGNDNSPITSATKCYYSETEPTNTTYTYWHYIDGIPSIWR